jgi:hypothetical protein
LAPVGLLPLLLEGVVDTEALKTPSNPAAPNAPLAGEVTTGALYESPGEALKAVREDYLYWTEKLTDTSLQLSYAVIAANWAVFGSVDKLLSNFWSKLSIGLVVCALLLSVFSAKWMGELHRSQVDHAESDLARWDAEFNANAGKRVAWPFTNSIERLGRVTREMKAWLPLLSGVAFLIALLYR